jgi:hypothetical protein
MLDYLFARLILISLVSVDHGPYLYCMITILGLQEVDNMTREKIQDELKELKEAHAADEGIFFLLLSYQFYHYIYATLASFSKKA